MTKCGNVMIFGDDYGDNNCTFHCDLEKGHDGKHSETGVIRKKFPYTLTWEGDLVMLHAKCPKCGNEEDIESDMFEFYKKNEFGGYDCLVCETMMEIVP